MGLKPAMPAGGEKKTWPVKAVFALATFFGLGYAPIASGTAGTAGGVVLYLLLAHVPWPYYLLATVVVFGLAGWVAQVVKEATGQDDPSIVVIDEVVGFLAAMIFVPAQLGYIVAGFFIFRLLDVIKPWPARYFDREVKSGLGIVMDDVAAGLYTNLILQLFRLLLG